MIEAQRGGNTTPNPKGQPMNVTDTDATTRAKWTQDWPEFAEYLAKENPDNSHPACPIEKGCTYRHLAAYDGRFADLEWVCAEDGCIGWETGDCEHEAAAAHAKRGHVSE